MENWDDASNLLSFLKGYEKLTCLLDDSRRLFFFVVRSRYGDAHDQEFKKEKLNALAVGFY